MAAASSSIRPVTHETLRADFDENRLRVPLAVAEALYISLGGDLDFFVAESADEAQGQVGINWIGIDDPEIRYELGLGQNESAPTIFFLDVLLAYQQRGIGRALLDRAVDVVAEHGYDRVFLSVALGNTVARHLYVSSGFVSTSVTQVLPQYELGADGTYGDLVEAEMEFMVKDLRHHAENA